MEESAIRSKDVGTMYLLTKWHNQAYSNILTAQVQAGSNDPEAMISYFESKLTDLDRKVLMNEISVAYDHWKICNWMKEGRTQEAGQLLDKYLNSNVLYMFLNNMSEILGHSLRDICLRRKELMTPKQLDYFLFQQFAPDSFDEIAKYENAEAVGILSDIDPGEILVKMLHVPRYLSKELLEEMDMIEIEDHLGAIDIKKQLSNKEFADYGREYGLKKGLELNFREMTEDEESEMNRMDDLEESEDDELPPGIRTFEVFDCPSGKNLILTSPDTIDCLDLENYCWKRMIEDEFLSRDEKDFSIIKINNHDFAGYILFKYTVGTAGRMMLEVNEDEDDLFSSDEGDIFSSDLEF